MEREFQKLTQAQAGAWAPVLADLIEKCRLYAQHVTHRRGDLYMYRKDVLTEGARTLARITGEDEGGIMFPGHERRVMHEVKTRVHEEVVKHLHEDIPGKGKIKVGGSVTIWVVYGADSVPLGWCRPTGREDGRLAELTIMRGAQITGTAREVLKRGARPNSTSIPRYYRGSVWAPYSGKILYEGDMRLRKPYIITSFTALEPGELGISADRRSNESDGSSRQALVQIAIADYIRQHRMLVPENELANLETIAFAQGRNVDEVLREVLYDLFGIAA